MTVFPLAARRLPLAGGVQVDVTRVQVDAARVQVDVAHVCSATVPALIHGVLGRSHWPVINKSKSFFRKPAP
jgi:hypothetical protein